MERAEVPRHAPFVDIKILNVFLSSNFSSHSSCHDGNKE